VRLIQLLNQLEQQGTLGQLYQAGAITLTMYSHREIYNYYQALLNTPRYTDPPSKAVQATAEGCKAATSTVYRALRIMEHEVG
jgi:hypothetical protein